MKIKRILKLLLITFILIFSTVISINVFAANSKTVISVGYEADFGVIEDLTSVGNKGYGYDILEGIENNSNLSFEFIEYSNLTLALEDVQNGKLDMAGFISKTDLLESNFGFMSEPVISVNTVLAEKNNYNTYYNDPISINNKTISTYTTNTTNSIFDDYLDKNGISANIINNSYQDYLNYDADFYLVSMIDERASNMSSVLNLGIDELYFVTNKENTELLSTLDDAFWQTKVNNSLYLTYLSNKYFMEDTLTNHSLTRNQAEEISGQTFVVGYENDHNPIQFTDENGNPSGISVEILNTLAEKGNFNLEYREVDMSNLDNIYDEFDIILNIKESPDSLTNEFSSSITYTTLPLSLLLSNKADFSDTSTYKIGIYDYNTLSIQTLQNHYPNAEISFENSVSDAYFSLVSDEINAGIFTNTGLTYVEAVLDMENYSVSGIKMDLPLVLYVSNDISEQFLTSINLLISQINTSHIDDIVSTYTTEYSPEYNFIAFIVENRYIITLFLLIGILIAAALFIRSQTLKKRSMAALVNFDNITNLISLHRFNELVKDTLKNASPDEYELIVLDIDYFRIINNIYGFQIGSDTIINMSEKLIEVLEETDAIISRKVNETFIIFVKKGIVDPEFLCQQHLIPTVKEIVGKRYNLSMSVGVYVISDPTEPLNVMIDRALVAKTRGKGIHELTCRYFDENMRKYYEKTQEIVFGMNQAIEDEEFYLLYQPKVSCETLQIIGAESLVRWKKKSGELVFPNEFIPIFEANGFITKLDLYVFEHVCKFINTHSKKFEIPLISINFSGHTLIKSDIVENITDITKKHGISTSQLEIEITESAIIDDETLVIKRVSELRNLGYTVSMDDFGSGVSSLNRLSELKVDIVKMDKAFLDHHSHDADGDIIIESMINMSKKLNLKVVSEGVETLDQVLLMQKLGCDFIQGYYFDRPLPENDFAAKLLERKPYSLEN